MAERDQVEIRDPGNPNRKMSVPAKDFDPAKHEAWTSQDESEMELREHMAEVAQHPVPGPPAQMPAEAMSGHPLEDQPNAAVIEAPGSRAAEIIQRARGDVPIYMSGTRQDRAEMETRRAESLQGAPLVSPRQTEEDRELRRREYSRDQSIYKPDLERAQEKAVDQTEHEKARATEQLKLEEEQAKVGEGKAPDKKDPKA